MSDILPQYGIPSPALGAWAANLQPASWRGVPFAVEVDTYRGGRRIALHEYPYRDDPWLEDTGRRPGASPSSAFCSAMTCSTSAPR
jgi:prophage DNA circulation protein